MRDLRLILLLDFATYNIIKFMEFDGWNCFVLIMVKKMNGREVGAVCTVTTENHFLFSSVYFVSRL